MRLSYAQAVNVIQKGRLQLAARNRKNQWLSRLSQARRSEILSEEAVDKLENEDRHRS